jgi:hypothetical protein
VSALAVVGGTDAGTRAERLAAALAGGPATVAAGEGAELRGVESACAELRAVDAALAELEARSKLLRASLIAVARTQYDAEIHAGAVRTSIKLASADGKPVLVSFREVYGAIDPGSVDAARSLLGELWPAVVESSDTVKLADGATLAALRQACGPAWAGVAPLLVMAEKVRPKAGLAKLRAQHATDPDATEMLDVLASTMQTPQVRTK